MSRPRQQMATLNQSFVGTGTGDRAQGFWAQFQAARAKRRVYRQTVRELVGLTDRELADLGIHRTSITTVAIEAAYGK